MAKIKKTNILNYLKEKCYLKSETDSKIDAKADKNHASSANTYGLGTTGNYGHVKTINGLTQSSHQDGTALSAYQGKVLKSSVDGKAPTSHKSSANTYGVSDASNYGHAMASSANPVMDGTASAGTDNGKYAREGHVHPTDTSRAPTKHDSSANTYGLGTTSNYGHVKTINGLTQSSHQDGTALSAYQGKVLNDNINAINGANIKLNSSSNTSVEDAIGGKANTSHAHGSLTSGGALNSDITAVNKVAVTNSSNALKTIAKVPFANLSISKANITGLGIPESDTTYSAGTGLNLASNAFSVKYGNAAGTACQGNDGRLSDSRTPKSHAHGSITNGGAIGSTANKPIITGDSGVLKAGSFGTGANTFCQGNDGRLNNNARISFRASASGGDFTPNSVTITKGNALYIHVEDGNGTGLGGSTCHVNVYVNGTFNEKDISNGTSSITINLPVGTYPLFAEYYNENRVIACAFCKLVVQ